MSESENLRTPTSTPAGQDFATVANSQRRKRRRSKTSRRHKKQDPAGPRLFSDFGKSGHDLLTKGYSHDQTLSIITQSCNGVISAALTFGAKFFPSTKVKASLILPQIQFEQRKAHLNLKVHQSFRNAALSISVCLNQSPDLTLSTTVGTSIVAFGMQSKYKMASLSFTQFDAGISVANRLQDTSIILADKGDLVRVAYVHHFHRPRKVSAIAEATRRLSKKKNSLAIGVSCIVDKLTTAKATLNNRGKLQALMVHKIKPNSSLNISGEFNVKHLDRIPKIGLALALVL